MSREKKSKFFGRWSATVLAAYVSSITILFSYIVLSVSGNANTRSQIEANLREKTLEYYEEINTRIFDLRAIEYKIVLSCQGNGEAYLTGVDRAYYEEEGRRISLVSTEDRQALEEQRLNAYINLVESYFISRLILHNEKLYRAVRAYTELDQVIADLCDPEAPTPTEFRLLHDHIIDLMTQELYVDGDYNFDKWRTVVYND